MARHSITQWLIITLTSSKRSLRIMIFPGKIFTTWTRRAISGEEVGKYFIPQTKQPEYKMQSGNLELVTIIECVSANGESIGPGFVFQSKEFCPEWFEMQPDIWWVF